MRVNLPKRLELWFITVFAFPNASRIGLHESTFSDSELSCADARRSSVDPFLVGWPHIARYFITILDDSVLPEPDSPEMMIDCEQPSTCAGEACGGGRERRARRNCADELRGGGGNGRTFIERYARSAIA